MKADYSGICAACHKAYPAGTPIWRPEGALSWQHIECPPAVLQPAHVDRVVHAKGWRRVGPRVEWEENEDGDIVAIHVTYREQDPDAEG